MLRATDKRKVIPRVLLVLENGEVGGIERLTLDLFSALSDESDIDCHLLFKDRRGPLYEEARLYEAQRRSDRRRSDSSRVHGGKGLWSLIRFFGSYDLIHLQGFDLTIAMAALAARRPVIYHEHGNFAFGRRLTWRDRTKHPLRKRFVTSQLVICAVAISHFIDSVATEFYGPEWKNKSVVIYNGSAMSMSQHLAQQNTSRNKTLGYLGRLAAVKRLHRLVDTVANCPAHWSARVVGEGPELERLQQLVRDSGLQDRITIHDATLDIDGFFEQVDCLILPSRNEGFGLVILEAWSHDVPAFVYADSGGAAEVVDILDPFFVCADPHEMSARIIEFFDEERHQIRFAENLPGVKEQFSMNVCADHLRSLYLSAVGQRDTLR